MNRNYNLGKGYFIIVLFSDRALLLNISPSKELLKPTRLVMPIFLQKCTAGDSYTILKCFSLNIGMQKSSTHHEDRKREGRGYKMLNAKLVFELTVKLTKFFHSYCGSIDKIYTIYKKYVDTNITVIVSINQL